MHDKDRLYTSANGSQECVNWNQYYSNCAPGPENPFKGAISFDNIGYAWIAIFQVISLEGWVDIMYYVMDAHSFFSFIYFILLIVIGSFFMINLWKVFNLFFRENVCRVTASFTTRTESGESFFVILNH